MPIPLVVVLTAVVVVLGLLVIREATKDDGTTTDTTVAPVATTVAPVTIASTAAPVTVPVSTAPVSVATTATTLPTATLPGSATTTSVAPTTAPGTIAPVAVTTLEVASLASSTFVDATHGWVTALDGEIPTTWVTADGGATWTEASVPDGATVVHFADATNGWAFATGQQWYSTHDGGATWTSLGDLGEAPNGDVFTSSGGRVYLATAQSDGVHVLVSPVDQDAFADLATPLAFGAGPVFDVSMAADGDLFWMVYNDRLVAGGILAEAGVADATWLPPAAALGGPVRVFAAAGTGRVWAIADTGVWGGDVEHPLSRIYLSVEGGVAWQELQSPPGTQLGLSFAAGFGNGLPTAYVSAGTDLTVTELDSISDPPGWTTVFTIADATVSSIAAPAAGVVDVRVSVTADGHQELRRSTDGGATWQTLVRAAA